MRRAMLWGLLALALATPAAAQQDTAQIRILSDSLRLELVRSRGFIRAAETQLSKTLSIADRIAALLATPIGTPLPPPDTTTPAPPDTTTPAAPAPGTITLDTLPVSRRADGLDRYWIVATARDSLGAPYVGDVTFIAVGAGGFHDQLYPTMVVATDTAGVANVEWRLPPGTAGSVIARAVGYDAIIGRPGSLPAGTTTAITFGGIPKFSVSVDVGSTFEACLVHLSGSVASPVIDTLRWSFVGDHAAVVRFVDAPSPGGAHCKTIEALVPIADLRDMGMVPEVLTVRGMKVRAGT